MNKAASLAILFTVALGVSGCQRLSSGPRYVAPLPASPVTPVAQEPLAPIAPAPGVVSDGTTAVASAEPVAVPSTAVAVTRSDLAGGWKISTMGDSCMAFMALTSWSGGYRANTRGCASSLLSGVSAWNLSGKQVVLKNSAGAVVAQLYAASPQQFSGKTSSGAAISMTR